MLKTGNIFIEVFSFISIIFPLLLAVYIFINKSYRNESLNFLMILCLLNFVRSFLLSTLRLNAAAQNIIENIFTPIELIILTQIFKNALSEKVNKLANIFLVVFLTVIITVYLLKGIGEKMPLIEVSQNGIIICISILCLAKLVGSNNLYILIEPLFWIGAGSLFYFCVSILMGTLTLHDPEIPRDNITGKEILLGIGSIAKYFFYTLAVFFYQPPYDEKENSSF
jgi:hypothetical protein